MQRGEPKDLRVVLRLAAVLGLVFGFSFGFMNSRPAYPSRSSPVTTLSETKAAERVCRDGYAVWGREGSRICG
jgi:hypothetical protein